VITAIDGRRMRDVAAVKNRIGLVRLGQTLKIRVLRDGKPLDIEATIEELTFVNPLLEGGEFADRETREGRRYVELIAVAADSALARYGLRAGDVILSVNRQQIESVNELELLAEVDQQEVLLLVQRGRKTQYVRLQS